MLSAYNINGDGINKNSGNDNNNDIYIIILLILKMKISILRIENKCDVSISSRVPLQRNNKPKYIQGENFDKFTSRWKDRTNKV